MGAVADSRGTTRTWSRDWSNVSATWIHSTETPVRHTESSEMWPGQMRRISPPMGRDRITCLPLRREPPDHKAHCWRVPTHCIPWRPATSTPSGSWCSGMVVETVIETVRVFQTNNNIKVARRGRPWTSWLTVRSTTHSRCPVTANAIASRLLNDGRFPYADRDFARWTPREVTSPSRAANAYANLSSDFTVEELETAIKKLKSGKAPGRDNIHPEFGIHQSPKTNAWLCSFLASCFRRSKLPKTWRRATVVALPRPNKPAQDPKSYRPITLLCVPFKILRGWYTAASTQWWTHSFLGNKPVDVVVDQRWTK